MSDRVPSWLQPTVDRIVEPRAIDDAAVPAGVTGALADLLRWWLARSIPYPSVANEGGNDAGVWNAPEVEVMFGRGGIADGIAAADRAVDAGATLLVPRIVDRDDVASRGLVALLSNKDAAAVMFQPTSMTDREWMDECVAVRDAISAATQLKGSPVELVEAAGSAAHSYAVGVLLGSAARSTPCLLDGIDVLAAAMVADRLAYRASRWWRLGSRSPDPGVAVAADRIDLDPGLALDLTDDDGLGAQATLALLESLVT